MSMNGIDLKPYIASKDLALEWKNVMIFLSIFYRNSNLSALRPHHIIKHIGL